MKRSYDEMISVLTELPQPFNQEQKIIKALLTGSHKLLVTKAVDISKATVRPIDDIDEPEEEQDAVQRRLDRNNARMIQLHLKDSKGVEIKAIETEKIDLITNLQQNWTIDISGPVDVRCGNIMMEKRHVTGAQPPKKEEVQIVDTPNAQPIQVIDAFEDWDEADEEDCIILD